MLKRAGVKRAGLGLVVLFIFVLFIWVASASAASLRAGVAKVEITPPVGLAMWGYANRKLPSKGTLDPLYARVLVLEAGETRLALVALDLGRTFGPWWMDQLREQARKSSGISYVLVAASHTHSGPVIVDEYPPGAAPDWEKTSLEKIAQAIDNAHQHSVEARLGTGYGVAYIGHNRLRLNPNGTITWFERNRTQIPTSPVDPTVSVLRVDSGSGKPLAVMVNYATHPVVFGSDNLQYSADYPGVTVRTVEQALGGETVGIFWQGAPGDINPYYAVTPLEQDGIKMRDWTGERLGQEAARVAGMIRTEPAPDASLEFAEEWMGVRLRWDPDKLRQALVRTMAPKTFEVYAKRLQPEIRLPVTIVLINKRIALMGMPGEAFVDFQINWRDRCPLRDAFFLGYANGYFGYFPTIRAASLGGYGAASSSTWVEVGTGERMVDRALAKLYEMLGRLRDLPDDLKVKD